MFDSPKTFNSLLTKNKSRNFIWKRFGLPIMEQEILCYWNTIFFFFYLKEHSFLLELDDPVDSTQLKSLRSVIL